MKFSDNLRKVWGKAKQTLSFALKLKDVAYKPKGEIFYKVKVDGVWSDPVLLCNVVTDDASILLARLMKDPTDPAGGVQYFALGTGNNAWDKFNPPAAASSAAALETEIARAVPASATFIDPNTFLPSVTPTNIVDWDFAFGETDAVGYLVECGLAGGDATGSANTGTLITYRTFPVISKTASMELAFVYRLTF